VVEWIFEMGSVLMLGMMEILMERLLLCQGEVGDDDEFDFPMPEASEQQEKTFASAATYINLEKIMV
jgi:hypothetical protein